MLCRSQKLDSRQTENLYGVADCQEKQTLHRKPLTTCRLMTK